MSTTESTAASSRTTFHLFPRLPKELRLRIWGFANSPRTVVVRRKFIIEKETEYLFSPGPVPGLMHACSESRSEALHKGLYTAAFVDAVDGHRAVLPPGAGQANLTVFGLPHLHTPPRRVASPIAAHPKISRYIWVNFDLDTIQIPDYALGLIKAEERARIRKAIVEVETTFYFLQFQLDSMSEMSSLEELELLSDVRLLWGRNLGWIKGQFEKWFNRSPKIKITEKAAGAQMNSTIYNQRAAALRARSQGNGR